MAENPQRQLLHDLRGVIAAANANVEYMREQGLEGELRAVADEITFELRLVADVISQMGQRDPERVVELDLRALLWLAARSGAHMRIDPTAPPFLVQGRAGTIGALIDALGRAVAPGAHGTIAVDPAARSCKVSGLDQGDALSEAEKIAVELGLRAHHEQGALVLR